MKAPVLTHFLQGSGAPAEALGSILENPPPTRACGGGLGEGAGGRSVCLSVSSWLPGTVLGRPPRVLT